MIKVGIVGYGNLGRGVDIALSHAPDMECIGVFTRRAPETVNTLTGVKVYGMADLIKFKGVIDVLILCGGSATDLPNTTKDILKDFCTVDSFDTHAKIPEYYDLLNEIAVKNGTVGAISIGWDPGLFSITRALFSSILPMGNDYTFWGKGVSQGHSDAIRRISGVKNAIQYTIPKDEALKMVRSGANPNLSVRDKHLRECFVVAKDGADKLEIENAIKTMPAYFADYDTVVHFIDEDEFNKNHSKLAHGGFVLRSGKTSDENNQLLELSIKLDSNPEFTGSVLVSYARAVSRLKAEGNKGVYTVLDIPVRYLAVESNEELRKHLL